MIIKTAIITTAEGISCVFLLFRPKNEFDLYKNGSVWNEFPKTHFNIFSAHILVSFAVQKS